MRFLLSMLMILFLAAPVCALDSTAAPGGFEGPVSGAQAETVDKAKKLHQDSRVALTGNILSRSC